MRFLRSAISRTVHLCGRQYSAAAAPASSISEIQASQDVLALADRICQLNLLETSQIVKILRERLNLPDIVPMAAAPMGGAAGAQNNAGSAAAEPPVEAKTEFTVRLEKFDPASKAKVIREIKALMPNLNLVEAKAFVEGAPKVIKERVKKDEAEKIKATLEALGATVALE